MNTVQDIISFIVQDLRRAHLFAIDVRVSLCLKKSSILADLQSLGFLPFINYDSLREINYAKLSAMEMVGLL